MHNDIIINISKNLIINLFVPVQPKMPPDKQIKRHILRLYGTSYNSIRHIKNSASFLKYKNKFYQIFKISTVNGKYI
jgi:hypothetical protein